MPLRKSFGNRFPNDFHLSVKTITGNQSYGEKFVTQLTNDLDLGNPALQMALMTLNSALEMAE
jgi:hypothetical protein